MLKCVKIKVSMKFQEGRVLSGLKKGRKALEVVPRDVGTCLNGQDGHIDRQRGGETEWCAEWTP